MVVKHMEAESLFGHHVNPEKNGHMGIFLTFHNQSIWSFKVEDMLVGYVPFSSCVFPLFFFIKQPYHKSLDSSFFPSLHILHFILFKPLLEATCQLFLFFVSFLINFIIYVFNDPPTVKSAFWLSHFTSHDTRYIWCWLLLLLTRGLEVFTTIIKNEIFAFKQIVK